jgi:thiosulfate/3-mercaptopyruvate sulfurtransferase
MLSLARTIVKPTGSLAKLSARSMSATASSTPLLVSPKDVRGGVQNTVFLDASWHMPGSPRNAREEYKQRHIPGARYLDLDEVASQNELGLKHMLPGSSHFAKAMGECSNNDGELELI